jgi:hypothetical protein
MTLARSHRRPLPSSLLLAATLSACSGSVTSPAAQQGITVEVQPAEAQVLPSGTVSFLAAVTGTADTTVLWDVVEANGGTVDGSGRYTAPPSTGTFHVRARSAADTASQGIAVVTVTPAPVVAVTIAPRTASVSTGGSLTFGATVTGTSDTAVTWSVLETSGCGSVTQAGVYTAPATARTCHVVATSSADPSKSDTATVTVTAPPVVTVSLSPSSGATDACLSLTFRATVTGAADTSVTWTVQEGAAGGTITSAGVYTAPPDAGTYHVVATSRADPSKSAVAAVVVTDRIVSVAVSPGALSIPAGGTAQFTATVTTTCGTFTSSSTVTSDGTVLAN